MTTSLVLLSRLDGLFDHVDALDEDTPLGGKNLEHCALLAFASAGDDGDSITFFDVGFHVCKSEHFRCKGNDLHEVLVAQLTSDWAEDACALGVVVLVDDDDGVLVKAEN